MSSIRSNRTNRSLTFISTLLLTTALAAPAFAQIEEVVVTAQKRAEDIQTVPIAISAYTAEDLKARQISQFKDLQFSAPNVSYTSTNFQAGADFQIRGIGITAIGYDSESGVAVNQNEVYLANPQINEGSFYDLSGVEVLAGPQSTLYGRGATGGAVNINFAKPDTETFGTNAVVSYGNYNAINVSGMLNIPIVTDQLAVRFAGNWVKRDGFVTNIYDGNDVDGRDDWSFRGSARWTPTSNTTIDVAGQIGRERDDHLRSDKQLCTADQTGVLGCSPNSAGTDPVNPFSTLSVIASSQQGFENALGMTGLAPYAPFLGIFNLASAQTLPAGYVDPSGARQINTDFNPVYHTQDDFLSGKWQQTITPWLTANLIGGYDHNNVFSQESYNNIPGLGFPTNTTAGACLASALGNPNINCAAGTFLTLANVLGGPAYAANYAPFFSQVGNGALPETTIGNLGLTGGNYSFTNKSEGYDQSDGSTGQYSGELRFNTNFEGPLNAMIGGYYLRTHVTGDYYVVSPTLDYPGIVLGGLNGTNPLLGGFCITTGCTLGPTYYHNYGQTDSLISKAIYGEVYYSLIPDVLKFTGGLRYTQDEKFQRGRVELFDGLIPIGTTNEVSGVDTGRAIAHTPAYDVTDQKFNNLSGHITADWTPKLDFTDQTLVYATYARGYKAGGANPGIEPGFGLGLEVPATYKSEFINSFEVGTKNQFLQGTVQANGDAYYYDYTGLQVSAIEDNTSVNQNVDAKLYGVEGTLLWVPDDRWQFSVNVAGEHSSIENAHLLDERNPTAGDPNTLLVKDDSISANTGSNCVLYYTGAFPGLPAGYTAPAAGVHALASQGIANAAFGVCPSTAPQIAALAAQGYETVDPRDPNNKLIGELENLSGNSVQNTPELSLSGSVQYTYPIGSGYNLVGRIDDHYQTHMWGRIFEDGADRISAQNVTNASLQFNALEDNYYVQGFIKNIFNANNITGEYLTSPTSGLYTNAFYGDPRTYGVEVGVKF